MKILPSKPLLAASIAALALARPAPAQAFSPYLVVPDPKVAEASPAYRYANMTDAEALAELDRRKIIYTKLGAVPGVRAPIRLTTRLHGVYIHSSLPPEQRVTTMFEILDARLALALDDFAAILERHDIDEVVHYTMYRPNVAAPSHGVEADPVAHAAAIRPRSSFGGAHPPAAPPVKQPVALNATPLKAPPPLGTKGEIDGQKAVLAQPTLAKQKGGEPAPKPVLTVTAKKGAPRPVGVSAGPLNPLTASVAPKAAPSIAPPGKRPTSPMARREPPPSGLHQTTWAAPGTRHPAGLAIDVGLLHRRDGRWLNIASQFHGHIGNKTCGEGAYVPESADARELRALVCEASDLGVFTYVLTPDYNAAHADHFHMEIRSGVKWFLYH